jgi:hypothetical protein
LGEKFLTALNLTKIPATVNSWEKLIVWATLAQTRMTTSLPSLIEVSGFPPEKRVQWSIQKAETGVEIVICRSTFAIDEAYKNTNTQYLWEFITDLNNVTPPTGFLLP